MRRSRIIGTAGALAVAGLVASACSAAAGTGATEAAAAAATPGLKRYATCDRFLADVRRRALGTVGPWGFGSGRAVDLPLPAADRAAAMPAAPAAGAGAPVEGVDYSGTNLQEAGVDEPDLVKTDGRTLFAIAGGSVRIADVSGGYARALGEGFTPDAMYPTGLVLSGDRLVVLGDGQGTGIVRAAAPGGVVIDDIGPAPSWSPTTVMVELDVSDPAHPRVLTRTTVDGSLVAARRTDGTLRVVLATSPDRVPIVLPAASGRAAERAALRANRRAVLRARARAWLPRIKVRDATAGTVRARPAVACADVSRPTRFAGLGLVTVLTLDVPGDLRVLDSDAVMTDGELVYASRDSLWIATPRWTEPDAAGDAPPPRGSTQVHRLDTSDPARTVYRASGAVRGYVLNAFSMSEQDGRLRVATTEEPPWWDAGDDLGRPSESFVTVLGEREGRLVREGEVGGLGHGERIQAVRFVGDRGYVVTFRQTDPLYVVDVADPAHPVVRGALKVPGFSSYLHPVGDHLLIGIGQAADANGSTTGTQVSLFDVSDPAAPKRLAHRELDSSWSEAESDHHAVLWWPARRLLVMPVETWSSFPGNQGTGAVGLDVGTDTGITPLARVRHPSHDGWAAPVRRSLVVGDALLTVSDEGVMASDLATLARRAWLPFG